MSARDLPVYVTQAATAQTALWLRRVLGPAVEACQFDKTLPLEVRPVGAWAGLCGSRTFAPDLRVSLSSKVVFWEAENIVSVYIHECCHRLLEGREIAAHGPEFFCLNAALLLRCSSFFRLDPLFKTDLYDLQDCPFEPDGEPNWRGVVLGWALPLAVELAATDVTAEQLASLVCDRWQEFLLEREQSSVDQVRQAVVNRKFAAAQGKKIEDLQSSLFAARTFLVVGWICFFSVCVFVF